LVELDEVISNQLLEILAEWDVLLQDVSDLGGETPEFPYFDSSTDTGSL